MTDTDKLTEILNKVHLHGASGQEGDVDGLSPRQAHSAILDLFKSLVPEDGGYGSLELYRNEIIANIEKLRQ